MLVTCVVLTVAAPYVGIAVAFTFILCIAIQRFYLRTSRQVRRMDFIAKSPLYTLFAETVDVNGLRTFRAARAEDSLAGLAVAKGNTSQVPYYYMNGVKKWLNLVLGGVTTGINTILVTVAVIQRANTSSGLLAVALVQAVQLTFFLNHTIVSLADFETALVALSRIQEVIELPPEEVVGPDGKSHAPVGGIDYSEDVDDEDKDVGIPLKQKGKADEWDWITAGSVRFQNVVLKYRPELPPALKNLSFKVPGGQKVGIVGRSGCGKSTALQALFRMVECESGSIYIDGVDIRSMPRTMLRSAMTIIPQDPLLLELSIRENLDLEGTCSDQELWAALEQTQCKSLVEALPEKLETLVSGDGGDFSRGERQLLALARALLRKRKILVLDEASSSLDIASDARMQEVLRRAFDRCTIITVAHRLNTLLDYDEIIVLSAGELVEQGNPQRLLRGSPNGPFSQLVRGEQAAVEGEEAQEDLDIIRELA